MTKPIRIQLSRKKGWRMPPNTISVARPGGWGNPFRVVRDQGKWWCMLNREEGIPFTNREAAVRQAIQCYRERNIDGPDKIWNGVFRDSAIEELRGKNLACFCPLDQSCHADILIEIANR